MPKFQIVKNKSGKPPAPIKDKNLQACVERAQRVPGRMARSQSGAPYEWALNEVLTQWELSQKPIQHSQGAYRDARYLAQQKKAGERIMHVYAWLQANQPTYQNQNTASELRQILRLCAS